MSKKSTVSIVMRDVELNVSVGEHPWEKFPQRPTRLLVSLTLSFDYHDYISTHGGYVDYDPLRAFLLSLEGRPHTNKIEELARDILKAAFSMTAAARAELSLAKPDIFNEMGAVGLRIDVAREDFGA